MAELSALAVGRLVEVKGFDVLIDAWRDTDIPLTIVGDGERREELHRKVLKLGLEDRISFAGERRDAFTMMQQADIVVVSSHREGFSYVILEALQAECIVVATETGVAPDLLPERYRVRVRDAQALADAVNLIAAGIEEARAEFAPIWAEAKSLTVERMVQQVESVYRRAINLRA